MEPLSDYPVIVHRPDLVRPRRPWWLEVPLALLAFAALVLAFVFVTATPAGAELIHTGPAHDTTANAFLSGPWPTMAVAVFIPLLVNLVTNSAAASGLKAFLLLVLSAVTAAVSTIVDNGGVLIADKFVGAFFTVFLIATGTHVVTNGNVGAKLRAAVPGGLGKPPGP